MNTRYLYLPQYFIFRKIQCNCAHCKLLSCFFCLVGVLRRFQHCTGHITTGSWKGRGNQYIEFARVVYCKLPTNGKQLPAFPLKAVTGIEPPTSEVGGESVTTLPPWPPLSCPKKIINIMKIMKQQFVSKKHQNKFA